MFRLLGLMSICLPWFLHACTLICHAIVFNVCSIPAPVGKVVYILGCHVVYLPLSFSIAEHSIEAWRVLHRLAVGGCCARVVTWRGKGTGQF